MITYYEILQDGTIGRSTPSERVAKAIGLQLSTENEIVYGYDGRRYFAGDEPEKPLEVADYDEAMEQHILQARYDRGYTSREPSDYAGSRVERWAQDAQDWIRFRDDVMLYALSVENAVSAGATPPTLDEFKAGLPLPEWTYE